LERQTRARDEVRIDRRDGSAQHPTDVQGRLALRVRRGVRSGVSWRARVCLSKRAGHAGSDAEASSMLVPDFGACSAGVRISRLWTGHRQDYHWNAGAESGTERENGHVA
jgi:hypothetical protein